MQNWTPCLGPERVQRDFRWRSCTEQSSECIAATAWLPLLGAVQAEARWAARVGNRLLPEQDPALMLSHLEACLVPQRERLGAIALSNPAHCPAREALQRRALLKGPDAASGQVLPENPCLTCWRRQA